MNSGLLEVWIEAIAPVNLPITVLVGLMAAFWVLNIVGVLGTEFLDVILPFDLDLDLPFFGGGFLSSFLGFFHVGKVPLVILLSVFIFLLWFPVMIGNHYFNPDKLWSIAGIIYLPSAIGSLLGTKIVVWPFAKLFSHFAQEATEVPVDFLGEVCKVRSLRVNHKFGQAEYPNPDGAPYLLNVRTIRDDEVLEKGDSAVIVEKRNKTYMIKKLEI